MEVQKGAQYTYQAEMVIGNNFIPSIALLVHLSRIAHPTVDCYEFTRPQAWCQ